MKQMIYGPVPSRRLGTSLGVDILPYKTCSYDCIYCQLGKTTNHTTQRRCFVPVDSVIKEVTGQNSDTDYMTFSGSGEQTLNKDIGRMVEKVKKITPISVTVLVNGSLLWYQRVRGDLSQADLVFHSLDAVSEAICGKNLVSADSSNQQ